MPRKFGSTLFAIVITAIVVVWLASEPPRSRGEAARERAQIETPRAAPETLEAPARDAVDVPGEAPAPAVEDQAPPAPLAQTWWRDCAPGHVEVLVLLDREPHAAALVRLTLARSGGEPLEASTDASGLAHFGPLEGDLDLQVEAAIEPDLRAAIGALWYAGKPTARLVIHFGRGGVEGNVYDVDGLPLADAEVQLELLPDAAGNGWGRSVSTASDGAYRIAGVPHGIATLYAGKRDAPMPRRIHVVVEEGQWVRADFGRAGGAARWSGRLLLSSGALARGLEQLTLSDVATGEQHVVRCTRPGEFVAEIPPGDYRASAWMVGGESVLGTAHVEAGDSARDLIVPGIELSGSVTYSGAEPQPERVPPSVQVWIENVATQRKHLANRPNGYEHYAFSGLEPGEYIVTTWERPLLGGGKSGLRVVLDAARDQVQLDLTVTDL